VAFFSRNPKKPAVSADLGRPETPEETAARKSEQSRLYRARKTINNLVYSLLVTVGLAVVIYFLVPHSEPTPNWAVDYVQISAQAQGTVTSPLDTPVMPSDWKANKAELKLSPSDKVVVWYIGFITPTSTYIGYRQGLDANDTWRASVLKDLKATGTKKIGGVEWTEYDNRSAEQPGNLAYALVTVAGGDVFVLNGNADNKDFEAIATKVASGLPE
jgi:hypothetical protein